MKEYQETHVSNKTYYRHHKVLVSAKKNNDRLPNYHFCFLRKKLYKTFHWMDQPLFYLWWFKIFEIL